MGLNISTTILEYLNEKEDTKTELILYHGSGENKPIQKFHNNQFYTINDYIACNYAENNGGLVYKVKASIKKTLELKGNYVRLGGESMKTIEPKQYNLEYDLIKKLYGNSALEFWTRHGFNPSPANVFSGDYTPLINWAKENGYDSVKFFDESFDTFVRDITYIIFNGDDIKILEINEPNCSS